MSTTPTISVKGSEESDSDYRKPWANRVEYFLATLGYCVGLGAFTRFPYLVMNNGGGAFLIPFLFISITVGIPLTYLEMLLGQFTGKSPLGCWSLCPAFKGLGYSMSLLSIVAALYYMPLTWCTLYFACSFNVEVPWKTCNHEWNTEDCALRNKTVISMEQNNTVGFNSTNNATVFAGTSPSEEFFNFYILGLDSNLSNSITNLGTIRWQLALAHLACWAFVFFCAMKGTLIAGKVMYVTTTIPYVLLAVLLIRGVTMEGSMEGLRFFLKPDFSKLLEKDVWIEAAVQVLYQFGVSWGGLVALSSFADFHLTNYWDAFLIPISNLLTAVFGGMAVFANVGYMSYRYGVPISEVAKSGPGLAFVAYPEAIAQMPLPQVWSMMFFFMIMTLSADSLYGMFETFVSGFLDIIPSLRKHQVATTAVCAIACFLVSLIFCTEGGIYPYTLVDWYSSVLSYTMDWKDFTALMHGSRPSKLWGIAWLGITPAMTLVIAYFGLAKLDLPEYKFSDYNYPDWAIYIGWAVSLISFLPTPLMLIYIVVTTPGTCKEKLKKCFSPTEEWLPNCPEFVNDYRKRWYEKKPSVDVDDAGGGSDDREADRDAELVPLNTLQSTERI